jgi:hypothetical protein
LFYNYCTRYLELYFSREEIVLFYGHGTIFSHELFVRNRREQESLVTSRSRVSVHDDDPFFDSMIGLMPLVLAN